MDLGRGGDRHVLETAPLQLLRSAMSTRAADAPRPGSPFALDFTGRQEMESHGLKERNNDFVAWVWETNFALDDAFYKSQLESQASAAAQAGPNRWVEYQTPKTRSGQWSFYHCEAIGWSTWEKPRDPYEVARAVQVEWEEHAFYAPYRMRWRYFYYNRRSGASTWWRPSEAYAPCFETVPCPFPARWRPWD